MSELRPLPRLLVPLAVFAVLAAPVAFQRSFPGDGRLVGFSERAWTELSGSILETTLETGMVVGAILGVAVLVLLVVRGAPGQAAFWGLALAGPLVLTPVLKEAFDRPSVGDKPGDSFPSGNAMAAAAFVSAAMLVAPSSRARRWVLALGVPLVVGYGVLLVFGLWHHPSDVVAGWCIGVLWVNCVWLALRPTGEPRSSR